MSLSLYQGYILDNTAIIDFSRRISPEEIRFSANVLLDELIRDGKVVSPKEVELELERHASPGDQVISWCKARKGIFEDISANEQVLLARVLSEYPDMLKVDGEGPDADPILVAMGMDRGWTVVSRDGIGNKSNIPKLKQICDHFGVRMITEVEMLRENEWGLRLAKI